MQLLMPNKRYDLFIDLDDIDIDDPDSYKYMFWNITRTRL